MSDKYASFIGKWVNVKCKSFICTGTIETVHENWILLSNAENSDCNITSTHKGIDVSLIENIEFIAKPKKSITISDKIESIKSKPVVFNVFTSETQPPVIRRGGSNSAVDRNNRRNSIELSQRYNSPLIGTPIANRSLDYGRIDFTPNEFEATIESQRNSFFDNRMHCGDRFSPDIAHQMKSLSLRRNGGGGGNGIRSTEPAWMSFTPTESNCEFDFDGNLALFDKQAICGPSSGAGHNNWHKKQRNESSDSSDYSAAPGAVHRFANKSAAGGKSGSGRHHQHHDTHHRKYNRSHTFSFNSDDFLSPTDAPTNAPGSSDHTRPSWNIMDHLAQWQELYMPRPGAVTQTQHQQHQQQPPDLVREITQQQMKKKMPTKLKKTSVISIINSGKIFNHFNAFWNLDDEGQFPVFTVKQRDYLFDTASQLGIQSFDINNIVGETLSEFIITQVGGFSRINNANIKEIPKIAILLGRCSASVYVSYVAKDLLKKGCHILVFVDESSNSGVDLRMLYEIQIIKNLLSKSDSVLGYNLLTFNIKDLSDKRFDYVISGVESDSYTNNPNDHLKIWCSNQSSQILCVNPPKISQLLWKSAIFIGVPTFSHDDFSIIDPIPKVCKNRPAQLRNSHRKPDGLILLCNVKFPRHVFSFLNLDYHCPFSSKNWIRLYNDNDLCLVE